MQSRRGPVTAQRASGIAVVAAVHLAVIASLLRMEGPAVLVPELPPLRFQLLKPPPPVQKELPPLQPHLHPPSPSVPLPSIVIAEPAAPVALAKAAPVVTPVPIRAVMATRSGETAPMAIGDLGTSGMVRAKMDMDRSPDSCHNPAFPPDEDREAYGMAAVSLLIGPDGRVKGSRIDASSGHPLLDQATVESFARCTYIRGTVRGYPALTWYRIKWLWFLPRNQR